MKHEIAALEEINLAEIAESAQSLKSIVFNWLKPKQRIAFKSLVQNNGQTALCLLLYRGNELTQTLSFAVADVDAEYPHLDPFLRNLGAGFVCDESVIEDWYEKMEQQFDARWDENLFGTMILRDGIIPMALCHGLAVGGEMIIEILDDESLLERMDGDPMWQNYSGRVVSLMYEYADPRTRSGWGGDYLAMI